MDLRGAGLAQQRDDLLVVVPRTIESSTTMSRLPAHDLAQRAELDGHAALAHRLVGWMNVRPE